MKTELEISAELMPIAQILKLSESIKCTLVPGNENYIDKKGFTWELAVYEKTKLGFRFIFEHPEYISIGDLDTMKIEFNKGEVFVPPEKESEKLAVPTGYTLTLKIPPQGVNLMSQEEVKEAKNQGQGLVIGNLVASMVLK